MREKKIKNKTERGKKYMNDRYYDLAKDIIENDEAYVNSLYDQEREKEIDIIRENVMKSYSKNKSTIGSHEEYVTLKDSLINYLKFSKDVEKSIENLYPVFHTLPNNVLIKYDAEFKKLDLIYKLIKTFKEYSNGDPRFGEQSFTFSSAKLTNKERAKKLNSILDSIEKIINKSINNVDELLSSIRQFAGGSRFTQVFESWNESSSKTPTKYL
jgi:glutamyl/glutaminyl-tRNA synthetase